MDNKLRCASMAVGVSALLATSMGIAFGQSETIGGGTISSPAVGPAPSYGIGGSGMVLVKNWDFGTSGTIPNYSTMNANFQYHDEFGTFNNGGNYGSNTVAPDAADAISGQPIEGVDTVGPVRTVTSTSLVTYLQPLDGATTVAPWNHNVGNGSFQPKWNLPAGGSLLGQDMVWETRVRYVTPPYFWFALWTAGNQWLWNSQGAQGAEMDLIESFGFDNGCGSGCTNFNGAQWHSNTVATPSKDTDYYYSWGASMGGHGISSYDATQCHTWDLLYRADNSFAMYVDGIEVQAGNNYWWTYGNQQGETPINMSFRIDAGWGANNVGSVDKSMAASQLGGTYYEFDYSRVYLSNPVGEPISNGYHQVKPLYTNNVILDAAGYGTGNGTTVDLWQPNGGANQSWLFTNIGANTYTIQPSYDTGISLNAGGLGSLINLWQNEFATQPQWIVTPTWGGYTLTPVCTPGGRMDGSGWNTGNGTAVDIWSATGNQNQTWIIQ